MKLRQLDFDLLIESTCNVLPQFFRTVWNKKLLNFLAFPERLLFSFDLKIELSKFFHHYKSYDFREGKLVIALLQFYERREVFEIIFDWPITPNQVLDVFYIEKTLWLHKLL